MNYFNYLTIANNYYGAMKERSYTKWDDLTTSWMDFCAAEWCEPKEHGAIKKTYHQLMKYCKGNYKYLTELVIVLNWKIWFFYDYSNYLKKNGRDREAQWAETFGRLYNTLWEEADGYACNNLKGEALHYFYEMTD